MKQARPRSSIAVADVESHSMIQRVIRILPRTLLVMVGLSLVASVPMGCGANDNGGIDVEKSKQIAAEKGINPAGIPAEGKAAKSTPTGGLGLPPGKK
jgi:hypothetical protein